MLTQKLGQSGPEGKVAGAKHPGWALGQNWFAADLCLSVLRALTYGRLDLDANSLSWIIALLGLKMKMLVQSHIYLSSSLLCACMLYEHYLTSIGFCFLLSFPRTGSLSNHVYRCLRQRILFPLLTLRILHSNFMKLYLSGSHDTHMHNWVSHNRFSFVSHPTFNTAHGNRVLGRIRNG